MLDAENADLLWCRHRDCKKLSIATPGKLDLLWCRHRDSKKLSIAMPGKLDLL